MKNRMYGNFPDGTTDSWLIEEDTIEEVQEVAFKIKEIRELTDCWSEAIEE
jgi:hypothetical protein